MRGFKQLTWIDCRKQVMWVDNHNGKLYIHGNSRKTVSLGQQVGATTKLGQYQRWAPSVAGKGIAAPAHPSQEAEVLSGVLNMTQRS